MKLKILNTLKLVFITNKINTTLAPILGQYNVNIMSFSNEIKQLTANFINNIEIPITILIYSNKEYSYILKKPSIFFFLNRVFLINKLFNEEIENDFDNMFNYIISIKQLYLISIYHQKKFNINLKSTYKGLLSTISSSKLNICVYD